jgi:hypothetical protein
MVNIEYANAYSEVLGILKCISKEDFNKIPNSKIELFETNRNKEYVFEYDPNKTLKEQNVSKRAKVIIGILFRDYWATEEQRNKIIKTQNFNRQILEEQKKAKYNVNDIFKEKSFENDIKENIEIKELVVYKETFFRKCINKIKSLFKIK